MTEVKKRFDELDGLKIFFALGVVLYHYWMGEGGEKVANCPKLSAFVYVYGWLGVEFFFILSGFLMEHTYRKIIDGLSFPQFMGRRLKSLYVPYLCAICAGIFVSFIDYILCQGKTLFWFGQQITVSTIFRCFSITAHGWVDESTVLLGTPWFINVLVLCYALYFTVLRFAKWSKIKPIYFYIMIMLFAWGGHQTGANFPFLFHNSTRGYWAFFAGCILYNIQESGVFNKKIYIIILDLIIFFFFTVGHKFGIPAILGDVRLVFIFFIFPVLILTAENLPVVKKILSCKILTFASNYSMDIYLTHMTVLLLTKIFNEYFDWKLNFASYKVLGCILLAVFVLAFVWHWLMAIITPAFNHWFVNFISPAKTEK